MWHQQHQQQTPQLYQRPTGPTSMPTNVEPNSWEDLYDSGHIDQQFNHLNIGSVPLVRQQQQQQRPPLIPHPPLMSMMIPPPHLMRQPPINNGYLARHQGGILPTPQVLAQPPTTVIAQRPRQQPRVTAPPQQSRPPGSYPRQPPVRINSAGPVIDTSVPPPRIPTLYQPPTVVQPSKPRPAYQSQSITKSSSSTAAPKERLTDADHSSPFGPTAPAVKIVGEDEHRTLCPVPGPKVKILKRPSSTPSNLCSANEELKSDLSNGVNGKNSSAMKSLKQREEEYAQARLRILGSAGSEAIAN